MLAMQGMYINPGKLKTYTPYKLFYDGLTNTLAGKRESPRMVEDDANRLLRWLELHNTLPESGILRYTANALIPLKSRTQELHPFQDPSSGNKVCNPIPNSSIADQRQELDFGQVVEFSEDHLAFSTTSRLCKHPFPWKMVNVGLSKEVLRKKLGSASSALITVWS